MYAASGLGLSLHQCHDASAREGPAGEGSIIMGEGL